MKRRGIDLRTHRATRFGREGVEWADVILTMTKSHKETMIRSAPMALGKTFTIPEYVGVGDEIKDPGGLLSVNLSANLSASLWHLKNRPVPCRCMPVSQLHDRR